MTTHDNCLWRCVKMSSTFMQSTFLETQGHTNQYFFWKKVIHRTHKDKVKKNLQISIQNSKQYFLLNLIRVQAAFLKYQIIHLSSHKMSSQSVTKQRFKLNNYSLRNTNSSLEKGKSKRHSIFLIQKRSTLAVIRT